MVEIKSKNKVKPQKKFLRSKTATMRNTLRVKTSLKYLKN